MVVTPIDPTHPTADEFQGLGDARHVLVIAYTKKDNRVSTFLLPRDEALEQFQEAWQTAWKRRRADSKAGSANVKLAGNDAFEEYLIGSMECVESLIIDEAKAVQALKYEVRPEDLTITINH
ncbi:MAG: hypothetical protein GKR97_04005 [Rhizobiaceae bacterium]|nr:hypothetical protein [Rhizobiaceae bacterium]